MARFSTSAGRKTLVTLKQKKKSLADAVNEELTASALGGADGADYAEGGVAEDYDFDDHSSTPNSDFDGERTYGTTKSGRAAASTTTKSTKGLRKVGASVLSSSSRLRHRGPLDASLSEGKYAATPVNVEAAMDDIFGALDMGDMDAEGEEFFDDDEDVEAFNGKGESKGSDYGDAVEFDSRAGSESSDEAAGPGAKKRRGEETKATAESAPSRKRRRAKDLTEDEYTIWLEKKRQREIKSGKLRHPLSFGGADSGNDAAINSEEADILRQLNELRQTQNVSLVPSNNVEAGGEPGSSVATTAAQSDAKATRDTVQHFIMVYSQLLRLRVLLQPAVTRAISLPQYYAKALFVERSAAVEEAAMAEAVNADEGHHVVEQLTEQRKAAAEKYEELREDLEDVLATLYAAATGHGSKPYENGEEVDEGTDCTHGSSRSSRRERVENNVMPSYRVVERYHERVLRHANNCLEYWGSKLVQANSAKLKTISQPLPQQIAAILTARSRLRSKVQKNRSHLNILAHPEHVRASTSAEVKAQRALHIAEGDVDTEIYDDADFLRELVRRGGAVANQLEQKVKEMQQTLLPSCEGARRGFHRMTKGKVVNYEPRPKLVGFMMAESLDDTQRNDVVVNSLFQ